MQKELRWRKSQNLPPSFRGLDSKPLIAIGAESPLLDPTESADYFHGSDGLGGIHTTHPHLSPSETWKALFEHPLPDSIITAAVDVTTELEDAETGPQGLEESFTPSLRPAHEEILRLLRENAADTITLVTLGPLTNAALAASADPETFLRVKEVVTMGGAVAATGNVTPFAEFNVYADPAAAALVFALTSPNPSTTLLPLFPPELKPFPKKLSRLLRLVLMSLDVTEKHHLDRSRFESKVLPLKEQGSPLAEWSCAFMEPMFGKIATPSLALHDPMCIWYCITDLTSWSFSEKSPEDIRVESLGQWTKGATVVDRRVGRKRRGSEGSVPSDRSDWLGREDVTGNRVWRVVGSPQTRRDGEVDGMFAEELLGRVFGPGKGDA